MNDFIKFLAQTVVNSYPDMKVSELGVGWQNVSKQGNAWVWMTEANLSNLNGVILVYKVTVSRSGRARAELLRMENAF